MAQYDVKDVLRKYAELLDDQDAMAARHKSEVEPLAKKVEALELYLQRELIASGLEQFKVSGVGTFKRKDAERVTVPAPTFPEFIKYIAHDACVDAVTELLQGSENIIGTVALTELANNIADRVVLRGHWELMTKGVNKTNIKAVINETGVVPPGVKWETVKVPSFTRDRKGAAKAANVPTEEDSTNE